MEQIKAPAVVFPGQQESSGPYRIAYDLLARRAPREALEVLEAGLEVEPGNTGLRSLRAWAYFMRAQLGPAETELTKLVEDCPGDDWARHTLGRVLERQSRFAEALPHLRLAAAMTGDPEHETAVLRVERLLTTP
ncbi:tetratricopeptide repeat protein [Nocardioides limicola]|uniref:tetratricopeptide repeat protein n=1 Tax=Nocardioides limicola TaxID=2803368 RepID=UPI00193B959B|nr:tetratricopeptide repeat protein [Nocardioides sp. DJM-14]